LITENISSDLYSRHFQIFLHLLQVLRRTYVNDIHKKIGSLANLPKFVDFFDKSNQLLNYWKPLDIWSDSEQSKIPRPLKDLQKGVRCGNCLACENPQKWNFQKFKHCARCGLEYYCSRECQVAAWTDHKQRCKRKKKKKK